MDKIKEINSAFIGHYTARIREHGPNAAGVDWLLPENAEVSYDRMLAVIAEPDRRRKVSFLDVGCGYGGLLSHAKEKGFDLDYTGIDIVPDMIAHAQRLHSAEKFIVGDVLTTENLNTYNYVVCNGIMTLKLAASILDMNKYAAALIRKMFAMADRGIAFNIMTNRVNFMADNSYYRSPVEILSFCLSELSNKVRLDHAYPRYEFTTYVYRE